MIRALSILLLFAIPLCAVEPKKKLTPKQQAMQKWRAGLKARGIVPKPLKPQLPANVSEHLDVVYAKYGEREMKLDLCVPKDAKKPMAAVVVVHGGGWLKGDKSKFRTLAQQLAANGFATAAISYRLGGEAKYPAAIHDCNASVRWLRANAKTYGIDPKRIGAVGGSAGGHLVAMLGVAGDKDGFDPDAGLYHDYSCRVQAVVPLYGVHDFAAFSESRGIGLSEKERIFCELASPVTYLSSDDPPFLILHGTRDSLVPYAQSEILQSAASEVNVEGELHIIKGAKHSFHLQPKQQDVRPLVIGFFDKHLK